MNLHTHIKSGDLTALKNQIQNNPELLNQTDNKGQTPLILSIKLKNTKAFDLLIQSGVDLELTDQINRTPLRTAVEFDNCDAIKKLLELNVDTGRKPHHPIKPTPVIDTGLIKKLFKKTVGSLTDTSFFNLDDISDDMNNYVPEPASVIQDVESAEALKLLIQHGEPLGQANPEIRNPFIGLRYDQKFTCHPQDFKKDANPRFGKSNPEKINSPFWVDMCHHGGNTYLAKNYFSRIKSIQHPIWCYDRHGHSLTALPDGRFIGIAGEHEDYYDPDFYIYNDVFVFDGKGSVDIYCYPRSIFPPTDFHSATLVGDKIYIIGNLGYPQDRQSDHTPVYALSLIDMSIQSIPTHGTPPGWVHKHHAQYNPQTHQIMIQDGKLFKNEEGLLPFKKIAYLDLDNMHWSFD